MFSGLTRERPTGGWRELERELDELRRQREGVASGESGNAPKEPASGQFLG